MKTIKIMPATFLVVSCVTASANTYATPAPAGEEAICVERISSIQYNLDQVTLTVKDPTSVHDALWDKLENAKDKILVHKYYDSLQKLGDFASTIESMVIPDRKNKQKISDADASLIMGTSTPDDDTDGVNGAIACVMGLTNY